MSDSDNDVVFPVSLAEAYISANLNSTLLIIFLGGLYTAVYCATMYIYVTRKASQKKGILVAITVLYGIITGNLVIQWCILNYTFVTQGDSRTSIFLASILGATKSLDFASAFLQYWTYPLADGLLVWRCFHMYNRSFLQVGMLLFLLLSEIVLCIAGIVLRAKVDFHGGVTVHIAKIVNALNGALGIVVAVTSAIATLMICWRIWKTVNNGHNGSGGRRIQRQYSHIVRFIIESSMLYSLSSVLFAVVQFVQHGVIDGPSAVSAAVALDYVQALSLMITGLAPTMMVGRIALYSARSTSGSPSETVQVPSELKFHTIQSSETALSEIVTTGNHPGGMNDAGEPISA